MCSFKKGEKVFSNFHGVILVFWDFFAKLTVLWDWKHDNYVFNLPTRKRKKIKLY